MPPTQTETIHDLLVRNIPRELVLAIEDALMAGAQRAYNDAMQRSIGHRASALGQLRHFCMAEAFHSVLEAWQANPAPLCGHKLVTGRSGILTLARFNIRYGDWNSGRRSQTRKQMAEANKAIEPLVQPELFSGYVPPAEATVFFVACFSGSLHVQPEAPISIQIAVPDRHMQGWLFREPMEEFAQRYDRVSGAQADLAVPKLKKHIGKKDATGS